MDTANQIKKIYTDINGTVTFVCEACGAAQKEPAEKYKNDDMREPLKIECPCGNAYFVEIEFRQFYRKETRLEGRYATASKPDFWERMIVKNVSLGGCGFEVVGALMMNMTEEIKVEFTLNDVRKSQIKKRAVVCSVRGQYVGCKFKELPGVFDSDLGFYLRKK